MRGEAIPQWLLAALLCIVLAVGATACDGSDDGGGGTETPPSGEPTSPSPDGGDSSIGGDENGVPPAGAALVNERCTVCHTLSRVQTADYDRSGWTEVVDRMISLGAELDDGERQVVIDYLTETDANDAD